MTEQQDALQHIAERLAALEGIISAQAALMDDPESILRHALHDLLRIYGLVAQLAEMAGNQHEQIQALADVMNMMLGRTIEHDRRAIHMATEQHTTALMVQAMASTDLVTAARAARALIETEALAQLAELAAHEQLARNRLRIARMDEREYLGTAAADAREVVTEAAQQARHDLASEQRIEAARDVNAE